MTKHNDSQSVINISEKSYVRICNILVIMCYYMFFTVQQPTSTCDVLPQPLFYFALADPLSATIYELINATPLYLDEAKCPICCC